MSKQKVGRPRIVETPEEFDRLVEEYRALCTENEIPVTFSGMARHLGFVSRQSLYDYEKREGFSYPVKRAQLMVEHEYEKRLHGNNVAGAIFALKNHGWSDRHDHTHTELPFNVEDATDEELARLVAGADVETILRERARIADRMSGNGVRVEHR